MTAKRLLSTVLILIFVLSAIPVSAGAESIPSARITGLDGSEENLRSSQLLEVVTAGFSENAKLKYTYDRSDVKKKVGRTTEYPYFWSFEKKDMFTSKYDQSQNGKTFSSDYKYFSLSSRLWYNNTHYNMTNDELKDITVTVTVKDTNYKSATYGKTATASYTGFKVPDLSADMSHAVIAMFEGDTENVLNLLGKAGVTHIACENCYIRDAAIADSKIARVKGDSNTHEIKAIKSGITEVNLEVYKSGRCAMHSDSTGKSVTHVKVFKRPLAKANETTVTLTNLEKGVAYTVNGVTKICDNADAPLVFDGLTPDTNYEFYIEATYTTTNGSHTAYSYTDINTLKQIVIPEPESESVPEFASSYAYIFGYNDSTMAAEKDVLKAEVSQMIYRLVKQNGELGGFYYDVNAQPAFSDIEGQWFRSGVEYLNYKGAFFGYGRNINPKMKIARGEAFKLICLGLGFADDNGLSVDEYAQILFDAKYIIGDENGNLNLDKAFSRAEFCTVFNRIIGREKASLKTADGVIVSAETYGFEDLIESEWYYDAMLKATSAYDSDGYVDLELRGQRNDLDDFE